MDTLLKCMADHDNKILPYIKKKVVPLIEEQKAKTKKKNKNKNKNKNKKKG